MLRLLHLTDEMSKNVAGKKWIHECDSQRDECFSSKYVASYFPYLGVQYEPSLLYYTECIRSLGPTLVQVQEDHFWPFLKRAAC